MKKNRIELCFEKLKTEKKAALIAFLTAGDPNLELSSKLINALPKAGADLIEIGMPFSDPMADGPIIQRSYIRALKSRISMNKTLGIVKKFRKENNYTPIILMGYYNPIYQMGINNFLGRAKASGVDGVLIVDLSPESSEEIYKEIKKSSLDFIRLASPTTDLKRMDEILKKSSGFIYYVSITGVTGSKLIKLVDIKKKYLSLKAKTKLPFVIGFGINSPKKAKDIASYSDGVVIGSNLIKEIENNINSDSKIKDNVINLVKKYSKALNKKK